MKEFVCIVLTIVLLLILEGLVEMLITWLASWIAAPILGIGLFAGFIAIIYFMMKEEEKHV